MSGFFGDALAQRMANKLMLDQQVVIESIVPSQSWTFYYQ
jgi:hypothetical protein